MNRWRCWLGQLLWLVALALIIYFFSEIPA
jgi:hypothetical protein